MSTVSANILCAWTPYGIYDVETTRSDEGYNIDITWSTPSDGGSDITDYNIYVMDASDDTGATYVDWTACSFADTEDSTTCELTYTNLITDLGYWGGDEIYAYVEACNAYGCSAYGETSSNNDVFYTVPVAIDDL